MPDFTQREQSLLDALTTRLESADAITADGILKEVEASQEYQNPSHPDHGAFLHMVPLAVGKQMQLAGEDPHASGTDSTSSMLDNQRYTHDIFPQEKPLDFSEDEKKYKTQRQNTQDYLTDLLKGKADNVPDEEHQAMIKGAQQQLIELDTQHATATTARNTEMERADKQGDDWAEEKQKQSAQMKDDFMKTRLNNVLPGDKEKVTELAEAEWKNLKTAYGF